jgi:hypothetical protein
MSLNLALLPKFVPALALLPKFVPASCVARTLLAPPCPPRDLSFPFTFLNNCMARLPVSDPASLAQAVTARLAELEASKAAATPLESLPVGGTLACLCTCTPHRQTLVAPSSGRCQLSYQPPFIFRQCGRTPACVLTMSVSGDCVHR